MAKKRFGPEQVVTKLRQIEVLMGGRQEPATSGSRCGHYRCESTVFLCQAH
jgi:hypothetical protein